MIWTDDTRQPVIEEIAVPFAEENGIVIAVQELNFGDIRDQLSLTGPSGEGPDIIIGAHDWLGELVANGVVAPLDISGVADGFNPVAVQAFTYEGQTYGLPYAVENIALVRNTDLVPEVPATFEEMIQIATDYQAENPDGLGLPLQIGPEGDAYHLQPFLSAFGGYIFGQNEDGTYNPEDLGIDSEGGLAAAAWLQEQAAAGLLNADVTYDTMIETFGAGNAPFVDHRAMGAQRGGSRLPGDGRAVRRVGDPRTRGRRGAGGLRRRPGLHDLVVLGAAGPGDQLRARLHEPGSEPARAVRGRRSSAGADVGVRPGVERSGHRRLRRVGGERHPAARDPGDEQRVGLARSRRGQHAPR